MGAQNIRLVAVLAAGLTALTLLLPRADAAVVSASSTPAKVSVEAPGAATVSVTWNLVRNVIDPPKPGTLSSPTLRIMIGGDLAATLTRPLSRSVKGLTSTETVSLHETVQIPRALIYRAVKQRAELRLVRSFADSIDDISASAELQVMPSGPASAALSVERLALTFDDGTRTRIVSKGSELRVVAEINTSGVGLLSGQWEVATGATTAGVPVFRPLALVRQGVAGGGRAVITSPRLPTSEEGTAFVRFRVMKPALAFDAPTLEYYVTPRAPGAPLVSQREIVVASPRPGDSLSAETRFAWTALAGAETYEIVFYAKPAAPDAGTPGGAPLAGLFVPGTSSQASLEPFTLAQLPGGKSYLWKVLAIDANGAVIGSSATREIHKP